MLFSQCDQEETGRNRKKQEETERNQKKQEKNGRKQGFIQFIARLGIIGKSGVQQLPIFVHFQYLIKTVMTVITIFTVMFNQNCQTETTKKNPPN